MIVIVTVIVTMIMMKIFLAGAVLVLAVNTTIQSHAYQTRRATFDSLTSSNVAKLQVQEKDRQELGWRQRQGLGKRRSQHFVPSASASDRDRLLLLPDRGCVFSTCSSLVYSRSKC